MLNEYEAYSQRLAQVRDKVPQLFDAESVLYVGATPRRFQLGKELHEAGCRITLLEAHKPHADHYEGHPWLDRVIHGDVCDVGSMNGYHWDAVVWWHGPEHIEREKLPGVLAELEKRAKLVVLGCPWGENKIGVLGGNIYSQHRTALDAPDLASLGYRTAMLGVRDRPDTWCHILAWKSMVKEMVDVVYTAIFGDYDQLRPAVGPAHYVCFTDGCFEAEGWEMIRVDRRQFDDPRREARMYKILAHQWIDAGISAWQDGSGRLMDDPAQHLDGLDLALFTHPERTCIYREADACVELGKGDTYYIAHQMDAYLRAGYPEQNGLAATGLLIRRHTSQVAALEDAWWSEVTRHTVRDQLSFDYVCWKLGVEYSLIPGNLWDNDVIGWQQHRKQ